MVCMIHLHSFASRPGSVATAGIGFRKATRHTQAQMPVLGSALEFGSRGLSDGCSYPAGSQTVGAWGEEVQRGMVSGAGGGKI
jgi:hypothetical protein